MYVCTHAHYFLIPTTPKTHIPKTLTTHHDHACPPYPQPHNPPTTTAAILLQGLKDLGLHHVSPADGAFYIYADVGDELDDAVEFAKGRGLIAVFGPVLYVYRCVYMYMCVFITLLPSRASSVAFDLPLSIPSPNADLLNTAHVAVTPGIDFEDPKSGLGRKRLRFSYCGAPEEITEAVRRLKEFWAQYPGVRVNQPAGKGKRGKGRQRK